MREQIDFAIQILQTYWGTSFLQWAFYAAILIILLLSKDQWKRMGFAWYACVVMICMINPITFRIASYVWGDSVAYYCRQFSLIPVFLIIAYAMVLLLQRCKSFLKLILTIVVVVFCIRHGNLLYAGLDTSKASNFTKVPNDVIEISRCFDDEDEVASIAVPSWLNLYLRQYDATLIQMTGRGEMNPLVENLNSPEMDAEYVMKELCKNGCDYVAALKTEENFRAFQALGYSPWKETSNFYIYEASGYDGIKNEYNKKQQKIYFCYTDQDGNLRMNLDAGFAAIKMEYDKRGYVISIHYYNEYGKPTMYNWEYAIVKREVDKEGNVIKEQFYDENGKPVVIEKSK